MEKSIESRNTQARMDYPTNDKFKLLVSSKSLDKCSVIASDVTNARTLFGPNRPGLRGKTVQHRPEQVIQEYLDIPRNIYRLQHFVTLTADVIFFNSLLF